MLKIMYMYIRIFKIWTNQSELLNNYRIYIVIKKKANCSKNCKRTNIRKKTKQIIS